jgi:hypothetical protein
MSVSTNATAFLTIALFSCLPLAAQAAGLACAPPDGDLADLTPAHFSSAQLEEMERSYAAQEVRGLRAALDTDLAGDATPRTARLLRAVPSSTLRSRFVLLSDNVGMFGGSFLTIQFKGYPQAVYRAWVYPLGSGPYDLRSWESARCSPEQRRWLKSRYGSLFSKVGG